MRLEGAWLSHPGTLAVLQMLSGYQVYFVGGCVRNAALGVPVSDIDITTDAEPNTVFERARAAGLHAVPTGLDHGTVTVVAKGLPHEITTFRRDVETDGRRAVVAFSGDIAEDAARRDFTMNALYADGAGDVLDPTGDGLADLKARRLRFIGKAEDRIREDYLRILRFFRFHAWYAEPGFEPDAIAAISSLSGGLETISKERIGHEMRKLLAAPDAAPALGTMEQVGVLRMILPGAQVVSEAQLEAAEQRYGQEAGWLRRLAALGGEAPENALRLSKPEAKGLAVRRAAIGTTQGPSELGYRHGEAVARDVLLLRAALLGAEPGTADFASARRATEVAFPVKAADLPGLLGKALGDHLRTLEARWIASDFTLTKADLLR